jgi:tRNA (mo5U34)-methyltransferase
MMARSQRTELLERINSFPYWHYSFDLGDGVIINPKDATSSRGTRDFIWPAVLALCGREDFKGLRVLDVACNAGFWSLQAANSGAEYVLGIDARPMHIEQAELVRDALGIDPGRLAYRTMNIYDLSAETVGTFDVCLVFRIIHHLRHPLLALDRLREVCRGFLVVDVRVIRQEGCVLQLHGEDEGDFLHGVDGLAFRPSKAAVERMLVSSGFSDIRFVPPNSDDHGSYAEGWRALFTARIRVWGEEPEKSAAPRGSAVKQGLGE